MNEEVKKSGKKKWPVIALGVFGLFTLIGIAGNSGEGSADQSSQVASAYDSGETLSEQDDVAIATAPDPADSLTGPQKNALRSAKDYLNLTGFSRDGLINQLSSSAGSGYDIGDATAAVDSLNVDWNEQAARSAKEYIQLTGFSCQGLIKQLSSSAGSKYTTEQASYGAQQAGAC